MELIVILVVVLLIFGPKNLPKLGSAIGKSVKNLRDGLDSGKKDKEDIEKAAGKAKKPADEEEAEVVVEGKPAPKSTAKDAAEE
jgi:sec-independent protein translocase protein TatA